MTTSACQGADPAITNVVSSSSENNGLTHFTLTTTVVNLGSQAQPGNELQSVDIYLDGVKNGEKGIPPLRAGQQYSFTYDVSRASDAEAGSTKVKLHLVHHGAQNCNDAKDRYQLKI